MRRQILYVVIATALLLNSEARSEEQRWSMLDGRLRISAPASWQPIAPDELKRYSSGPTLVQSGLVAPDGVTGLGLKFFDSSNEHVDFRSLKASLKQAHLDQGWEVPKADVVRISDRNFVTLHCFKVRAGLPIVNLIAATPLDDQLMLVSFFAAGEILDDVLLPLQMILVSLEVLDTPTAVADDENVRILPRAVVATAPSLENENAVRGLRRTIEGTGVTLNVPEDFVQAALLPGYCSSDGQLFLHVTKSGLPYDSARHFLDRAVLRRQGLDLQETESVEIDGRPAAICRTTFESENGPGQILLALVGNEEKSRLIQGQYPADVSFDMKSELRSALLSATWDPHEDLDIMEGLGFSLSETESLKILCRAHDRLVMSARGVRVPLDRNNHYAIVSIKGLGQAHESLSELATWWTKNSPTFSDFEENSRQERKFGDHEGFEIVGTVLDNQTKKRRDFYQALVRIENMYCLVQGFMNDYAAVDLVPEFEQLASSLQLNPK